MLAIKEQIKNNLEFLNDQQLIELANFSAYLKVRSKIQNSNLKNIEMFAQYSNEDKALAELGM